MQHDNNLIWVVEAKPIDGYMLELLFNNGKAGRFDCKPLIKKYKLFSKLEAPEVFNNITLDGWTVTWADGSIDIAPEYLYENSTELYPTREAAIDFAAENAL
ncbi:MAG: DUF2442 domain-containing protein [Bacteroidales bacterium]|nr:DUF2442 domain-containing protein [Bacteroidales bacterium]